MLKLQSLACRSSMDVQAARHRAEAGRAFLRLAKDCLLGELGVDFIRSLYFPAVQNWRRCNLADHSRAEPSLEFQLPLG